MKAVVLLLVHQKVAPPIDAYLITNGEKAQQQALIIAEKIRHLMPSLRLLNPCQESKLKNQFKKADKSGARYAFILNDEEIAKNMITVKQLREATEQITIPINDLPTTVPINQLTTDKSHE